MLHLACPTDTGVLNFWSRHGCLKVSLYGAMDNGGATMSVWRSSSSFGK